MKRAPITPIYTRFERFWHWSQAALILFLALTGFEVHGSFKFMGYAQAVRWHSAAALAFLTLIAITIFWHFTTGQWRQYIPTRDFLRAYVNYYLLGIFRGAPHPTRKTALRKLNPLQRLVYLGLKLLVIPVTAGSGVLYMLYRYPQSQGIGALNVDSLRWIAVVHTGAAFLIMGFVIVHVYLTTTGETPASNLRAMITGHEEDEAPEQATPADAPPAPQTPPSAAPTANALPDAPATDNAPDR